ncbi:alpha beta hydrolase fold protein [Colletotrichum asianum]
MKSVSFHRDVAQGLAQFYTKLATTPYLPPDDIQNPPPEGWTDSELDVDGLRTTLGRSDTAVDLLRHLPYLRPVDAGPHTGQWLIFPKTKAMRYLRDRSSLLEEHLEGLFELVHLPPDMISLTYPAGEYTLYGPQWWLVDCKSGRIVKYAGPPRGEALGEEFETEWKKAPSYSPGDFFAEVTAMLGKDYHPIPGLDGIEPDFSTPDRREIASSIYQTYMLAGWQHGRGPGPVFDREKCRKDLASFLKDRQTRESRKGKAEASRHKSRPPPRERRDPATYPTGYDRDAIVTGLNKYYERLAQMAFFPSSLIQYPPGERWGDDTFLPADKTRLLGFNERVIDLLRHLPYLDVDETHEDNRWPHENLTADKATPERLCVHGRFPFAKKMPDGLIPIAGGGGEGSDSGEWWIIDTNAGTVIVYDAGNKQVQDAPSDQPWLWTPPRPAGPLFDALVNSLYSLDLVPLPRPDTEDAEYYPEIWGTMREGEEEEDELADPGIEDARDIYREHGWPNLAGFRRQECYDALVEFRTKLVEEDEEEDYGPA